MASRYNACILLLYTLALAYTIDLSFSALPLHTKCLNDYCLLDIPDDVLAMHQHCYTQLIVQ